MFLIIAISHGGYDYDPYTCSMKVFTIECHPSNPVGCLRIICHTQRIEPGTVDELLIVDCKPRGGDDHEPEVEHHYTAGNNWQESDYDGWDVND